MFVLLLEASDKNTAESVVSSFYENLRILSELPDEQAVAASTIQCVDLCASDLFMYFPNEFVYMGADNVTSNADIIPSAYVTYFKRYFKGQNAVFDCAISSQGILREPEYGKVDDESFTYVYVKKKYSTTNANVVFVDTVLAKKENGTYKILGIQNVAGGNAFTHSSDNTNSSGNVMSMMVEAARYYTMKEYDKSYNMYLRIVDADEKNANAYYRLAIMSYKREGCRQYSRKETDRLAMKYITQAKSCGDRYIREKVSNVLYYW